MIFLCKVYVLRHSKMQDFFQRSLAFIPTASACSTTVPTPEGTKSKTEQIVWQKKSQCKQMQNSYGYLKLVHFHIRVCVRVCHYGSEQLLICRELSVTLSGQQISHRDMWNVRNTEVLMITGTGIAAWHTHTVWCVASHFLRTAASYKHVSHSSWLLSVVVVIRRVDVRCEERMGQRTKNYIDPWITAFSKDVVEKTPKTTQTIYFVYFHQV